MENKDLVNKTLLFSSVNFLRFAGIVKERAEKNKLSRDKCISDVFNDIRQKTDILDKLWNKYFSGISIDFSDGEYKQAFDKYFLFVRGGAEGSNNNLNVRLKSLITTVSLEDKVKSGYNLPMVEFGIDSLFAVNNGSVKEMTYSEIYSKLISGIIKAVKFIEKDNDLYIFSAKLDALFFRYLSNVPAYIDKDICDVSLYEYGKMVSAYLSGYIIGVETGMESDKYILIRGDFFSIQKFIFNKDFSNRNPAKMLRGKSFYVSLLSDMAVLYILKELGLPYFNIMMNGAGQFVVLGIDNSSLKVKEKINEIRKNIDNWLYSRYYASVSMGLSVIECSLEDFSNNNFYKLLQRLLVEKENKKLSRFDLLNRQDYVFNDYLEQFSESGMRCSYCGVDVISNSDEEGCEKCLSYIDLGKNLTHAKVINIYEDSSGIFGRFGYAYDKNSIDKAIFRFKIDLHSEEEIDYNVCDVVHYKSYAVRDGYEIRTFNDIASYPNSAGGMLGVFKADVDNLGLLFSCGLYNKNRDGSVDLSSNSVTFTKINMLSRSIHNFFSYYLYKLMSKKNLNLYTVFAGGDDLFMVGGYNDIINFAEILNKEFSRFTGSNNDVTISAGIGFFKAETPVWFMADDTESRLERAKIYRDKGVDFSSIRKGNISILYSESRFSLFIDEYNVFNKMLYDLGKYADKLTNSFYYKLMAYCDDQSEYLEKGNLNKLMWRSRLHYTVGRLGFGKDSSELKDKLIEYLVSKITDYPLLLKSLIAIKLYNTRTNKGVEDAE